MRIANLPQILYQFFTGERTQQILQPKSDVEQRWFANHLQKEVEQKKIEVQYSQEPRGTRIEAKGEKKNLQRRGKKEERKDRLQSPKPASPEDKYHERHVDIII